MNGLPNDRLPMVSVVIPVRNGAGTVGDTLQGLVHQAPYAGASEILVVDNGSVDATCEVVRSYPVTLLTEPRPGPAAARNRGLYAARGDIVVYLDADTLPTRRWLAEIAAPFADPRINLVAGRILAYQPTTPAERYYARCYLDRGEENARAEGFPFADSANMAVRRSAALAAGGWDEAFLASQDVDFSHRLLRMLPAPIHYQAGALVFLRNHTTLDGLAQQAFKYGQGRAYLWSRYPDEAPLHAARVLRIAAGLLRIFVWPAAARVAKATGRATDEDVTLAACHRLWTWWFWRGFLSMKRHRAWRPG